MDIHTVRTVVSLSHTADSPFDVIVEDYDRRLRAFLSAFVEQPSYQSYWKNGRVIWRAALPTELPLIINIWSKGKYSKMPMLRSTAYVAKANVVAARAIRELAPDIRRLSQRRILQHEDSGVRERVMTRDGTHFYPAVQVWYLCWLTPVVRMHEA